MYQRNNDMSSIPKALRQQCWLRYNGEKFRKKCNIKWCRNEITVFSFHVGHNVPKSKGGTLNLSNLVPICSNCNLSMSDNFTIDEWNALGGHTHKWLPSCCFTYKVPIIEKKKSSSSNNSSQSK